MLHDQLAVISLEPVDLKPSERQAPALTPDARTSSQDSSVGPWKFGDQNFVVHKVTIEPYCETPQELGTDTSSEEYTQDTEWPSTVPVPSMIPSTPYECSFLIDETLIPCLPTHPVSKPYPFHPSQTWPFEIIDTEYKGAAIFATRDIQTGEIILIEHPVIITPGILHDQKMSDAYEGLYEAVRPDLRKGLKDMYNCMPAEEPGLEEGIVRTNGTAVELKWPEGTKDSRMAEKMEYGAIFLLLDRANHSCGPNAAHKWDLQSLSSTLYALRPIQKGEEINITYTDGSASRATRRERLYGNFRFVCQCPYCDLESTDLVQESDLRRQELHDWLHTRTSFTKWLKDLCRADDAVIQSHLQALEIIEKEGMHSSQLFFLKEISLCYAVLGEIELFKQWGEKVVSLSRIQDPEEAENFGEWLKNPQSYKLWAYRKKQRQQSTSRKRAQVSPLSSPVWGLLTLTVEI